MYSLNSCKYVKKESKLDYLEKKCAKKSFVLVVSQKII